MGMSVCVCQDCGTQYTEQNGRLKAINYQPREGGEGQQGGEHYKGKTDPWELQRTMQTSGNAFVDARRADAIKYAWRSKEGKLLEDLRKAKHCIEAAIQALENIPPKYGWDGKKPEPLAEVKLSPRDPNKPPGF